MLSSVRYATGAVALGSALAFGGGCGSDDSKEGTASIDQSLDLDCTDDPDGRPEDLPEDVDEIYTPSAIKTLLEQDEVLRERFGADEINGCEEARRFVGIYKEEVERMSAEWLEKNPPDIDEDAPDAVESDFPHYDPPIPDDEMAAPDAGAGGAGTTEDAAAAGATADAEAAVDIQKINNGFNGWAYPGTVKIVVDGKPCSANIVSLRHLLTSAHCVTNGEKMTTISQQQRVSGAQPTLLFKGAIKVNFKRHDLYVPDVWAHDIAVGEIVGGSRFNADHVTGMWLGSINKGDMTYQWGYGMISPGGPAGVFHWGQGKVSWVGTAHYRVEWDAFRRQTVCYGDSGGFTSGSHGTGWFAIDAVNAACVCSKFSYVTKVSYHIKFITDLVEKTAGCADFWTGRGWERWCW
jgi:hypothetical protein